MLVEKGLRSGYHVLQVVLYSLTGQSGSRVPVVSLTKATEWNHNYTVISLVAHGHIVTIGDAISSVSVLEVIGKKIKSIARDYGPLWPVAVEALPGNGVIGGNVSCDPISLRGEPV